MNARSCHQFKIARPAPTIAVRAFLGTWEITKFSYCNGLITESNGLQGTKFCLDESGDIHWTVSDELKSVPLFSCETYELYTTQTCVNLIVILRFGAFAGHVLEFECDQGTIDNLCSALRKGETLNNMVLTCESWCTIFCTRIPDDIKTDEQHMEPFSFLPALEDSYFSDITIMTRNKKEIKAHSCILQLLGSDIAWNSKPPPFNGLEENILVTILHFLYTECLPSTLDEITAQEVIPIASQYPNLAKLVEMCQLYLKNTELKSQIMTLMNDMHESVELVIDHFKAKNLYLNGENSTLNPSALCYVIKQGIRETAVVGAKLLLLCELFTKRKAELSRAERHEIIVYSKSRLPIFLEQFIRLLKAIKNIFTAMTVEQRQEVAAYLVPEIEVILEIVSKITLETEKALQQIIQGIVPNESIKPRMSVSEMLGKSLKNVLHIRELSKLRNVHEQITSSLELIISKKDNFNVKTHSQKMRSVSRNLDQIVEELPMFLLKLEELLEELDEKIEWREFKFCFKVGTSKVYGITNKLVAHRDTLQHVILQVCQLVQRDAFTRAMLTLGLLNSASSSSSASDESPTRSNCSPSHSSNQHAKLTLVETLSVPPIAEHSELSRLALQLLKSELGTDMEFEVVSCSSGEQELASALVDDEKTIIRAHRVIVAARCDWFRRALLSGMREAIDKKIVIHDTNAFLFRIFLEYLYSGRLRHSSLSPEQYTELLLLSDKYEVDSLKKYCQLGIQSSIDLENALYYLSLADQFNAETLKDSTLAFIAHNPELMENEVFSDLPVDLQTEVFERACWSHSANKLTTENTTGNELWNRSKSNVSETRRSSGWEFDRRPHPSRQDTTTTSSSDEEFPVPDQERLQECLNQLEDIIVGATREELTRVVLAADYDLSRAINYYYSEGNGEK